MLHLTLGMACNVSPGDTAGCRQAKVRRAETQRGASAGSSQGPWMGGRLAP